VEAWQPLWRLRSEQIEVSFCETPSPTNRAIETPPKVQTTERQRPDRSIMRGQARDRDYAMSTHETQMSSAIFEDLTGSHRVGPKCFNAD
jgi:hypothetical protein